MSHSPVALYFIKCLSSLICFIKFRNVFGNTHFTCKTVPPLLTLDVSLVAGLNTEVSCEVTTATDYRDH